MLEERIIYEGTCDKCGFKQVLEQPEKNNARRELVWNYHWIILHSPRTLFHRESYFYMCPECVKKYIPMDKLPEELKSKYE